MRFTQGGTWTVAFNLAAAPPAGTAVLTVSASMTDGDSPTVAVNGGEGEYVFITGSVNGGELFVYVPRCASYYACAYALHFIFMCSVYTVYSRGTVHVP